jgi:hypothetical protein
LFAGHTDAGASETNEGTWSYEGDVLVLLAKKDPGPHRWTGTRTRFIPIGWGDAVDLIPEEAAAGFLGAMKSQRPPDLDKVHSLYYRKLDL